jgi:hypothetical protein
MRMLVLNLMPGGDPYAVADETTKLMELPVYALSRISKHKSFLSNSCCIFFAK